MSVHRPTIYIASKTRHAPRWLDLRGQGVPVVSTWIDEAGPGASKSLIDLASRCVSEAASADATILYCEPGDVLKGALVEVGAALASRKPVVSVGTCDSLSTALYHHPLWLHRDTIEDALATIHRLLCGVSP